MQFQNQDQKTRKGRGAYIVIGLIVLLLLVVLTAGSLAIVTYAGRAAAAKETSERMEKATDEYNSRPTKTIDPDPSKPAEGDKDPGGPYDVPKAEAPKPKPKDPNAGPALPKERNKAPAPTTPPEPKEESLPAPTKLAEPPEPPLPTETPSAIPGRGCTEPPSASSRHKCRG